MVNFYGYKYNLVNLTFDLATCNLSSWILKFAKTANKYLHNENVIEFLNNIGTQINKIESSPLTYNVKFTKLLDVRDFIVRVTKNSEYSKYGWILKGILIGKKKLLQFDENKIFNTLIFHLMYKKKKKNLKTDCIYFIRRDALPSSYYGHI